MEVYIEYVILDNFCVDFVLLSLVAKCVGSKSKWWKLLLSCTLGTVCAIVIPLFSLPIAVSILLKLLVGMLLVVLLLLKEPFVVKVVGFVLLMMFTFALGGMTLGMIFMLTGGPVETFAVSYGGGLPVGLVVLAMFLLIRAVVHLLKYVKERKRIGPFLKEVQMQIDGKKLTLSGFLDSGNTLRDVQTGLPVVVVPKHVLKRNMSQEWSKKLESGQLSQKSNAHYLTTKTANGTDKMLVFGVDWIKIGNVPKKAVVGVSKSEFNQIIKIEALFGMALA